jgi:maltooligosyltrehalose trehalohydrolase
MSRFHHELPFGAEWLGDGRTRFRLWAPDAAAVALELDEGGRRIPLERDDQGVHGGVVIASPGTAYRYRIGELAVPDPAARAQRGDVDGPSLVVDPRAYPWRHEDWAGRPWSGSVLYELHVGLAGGFAAVAADLPRLAALGITTVALMPVAEFPGGRNWGYDGVLPYAPDASYGSPDALKALIDTAHGLGLCVLLDVVYNHFGPAGNYLPQYAGAFFRTDAQTPWGGAIAMDRPQVSDFYVHNALYWLHEFRFDGLRLDAVHAIADRDWLLRLARRLRESAEPGRHVHLILENENNDAGLLETDFDAQWNDDLHHPLHVMLTGEREGYYADYAERPEAALARALAEGFVFQGQHSDHCGRPRGTPSGHLPPRAFVAFLQNHDHVGNRALGERLWALADPAAVRAALALVLLSPQVPMLFQGDENGINTPFHYFTSHDEELGRVVFEGRRREFARFRAFADAGALPDPNAPATFDACRPAQAGVDAATASLVRRALAWRAARLAPHLDELRSAGAEVLGERAVCARWRDRDGRGYSLWLNLGTAPVVLSEAPTLRFAEPAGAEADWARGLLPPYSCIAAGDLA